MIWLKNNQEDKLECYSALTYGKFMLENMKSFDDYMNTLISTGNIQEKTDDIIFHMNQLMDLYIHCKLLEKWIEVTTEKNRIKLFKTFSDLDSIKSICSLTSIYSYSRLNAMGSTANEYLQIDFDEFCKENLIYFQSSNTLLKGVHGIRKQYLAVKSFIDLYLMDYFWMYLRIFPNPDCADCIGQISTDIGILTIVDFIDADIFEINPLFMKERKITLSQKLSKAAIECLDNYRQLAQLIANRVTNHSSGTVINQILNEYSVINNFNYVNNSTVNHNETFNFESDEKIDEERNDPSTDEIKNLMFKKLQNNSGYKVFKAHLEQTDVYFKAFFDLGYITYLDEVVDFNAPFSQGAFAEFMKDSKFLFSEIRLSIPDSAYIDLTGRKFNQLEKRSDEVKKYADVKNALISKGVPVKQH